MCIEPRNADKCVAVKREVAGNPRAFHDALLAYGSVPVHAVTDELRAGAITT